MVYLLDPNTGTGMSQDHQFLAQAIAERYPLFRLAQVPLSDRSKNEEFPFAILYEPTKEVVKELRERDMNINTIFEWLYMNDVSVHGSLNVYNRYKQESQKRKDDVASITREKLMADIDVFHTIANSPLHTFRHGTRKFG